MTCSFVEMSLKDGMEMQEMETQHPAALTTEPGGSSSNGSNFVKAIDRKARSYFKTLERSFSSSMVSESGEDPSSMTIEFLRSRLQAQRADCKAEKLRAQQLAKKVLELEQKLSFEIERRKKAECRDMLISPRHESGSLGPIFFPHCNERANMTSEELREEGLAIIRSQFKDNSSYLANDEDRHSDWQSDIFGNEGHLDGDGVSLISSSCLRCHQESLRSNCQQRSYQHGSSLDKESDATSLDKEMSSNRKWLGKSVHKETRENLYKATDCEDYALHLEGQKASVNSEKMKMHVNTIDLKQDSALKPWIKAYSIDTQALKETGKYDRAPSKFKEVPESAHILLCSQPHRQARNFSKHAGETSMECLEHLSLDHSKQYATRATRDQSRQHFARAINSHQNYHGSIPDSSTLNPLHKMVSGDFADSTNLSPSSQEQSQRGFYLRDSQSGFVNAGVVELEGRYSPQLPPSMSPGHDRLHGYRFSHCDNPKELQQDRNLVREMKNQETEGKYVEAMQHLDSLRTFSSHGRRAHSENFLSSRENAIAKHDPYFSGMHTRPSAKLQGCRISLDGGLDRLREILKALEMTKRQVSS